MLYMVECGFSDPARERAWNDWYGGKRLDELLGVPGFRGSQRLQAQARAPARYLAVHWIDGLHVFDTPQYKAIGGGGFLGYQDCIIDWIRRFFDGWDRPLAVAAHERLLLADGGRATVAGSGVAWTWLVEHGPGQQPERGIARVAADRAEALSAASRGAWLAYAPLTPWRPGTRR